MTRKSPGLWLAAGAAMLALTFVGVESSGAFAQVAEPGQAGSAHTAGGPDQDGTPTFISQEVVQPTAETDASNGGPLAQQSRADSLHELVATTASDYALSDQMHCLAGAVYFESRGEPLAGQLAVAQVIINRAENPRFPSSYCGVVHQPAQFSFVRDGEMPRIRTGSEAWRRAKSIARIAHEGLWESEVDDALYFHAKYVRPGWSRKKVARAAISRHIFYR